MATIGGVIDAGIIHVSVIMLGFPVLLTLEISTGRIGLRISKKAGDGDKLILMVSFSK
jgi:hypothetical protein